VIEPSQENMESNFSKVDKASKPRPFTAQDFACLKRQMMNLLNIVFMLYGHNAFWVCSEGFHG